MNEEIGGGTTSFPHVSWGDKTPTSILLEKLYFHYFWGGIENFVGSQYQDIKRTLYENGEIATWIPTYFDENWRLHLHDIFKGVCLLR